MAEGIRRKKLASGSVTYIVTGYDPARGGGSREVGRARTLEDARRLKREFEDGKRKQRAAQVTCDEWADRWLDECASEHDWTASTIRHHEDALKPFRRDFAGVLLKDVTRPVAVAWAHGGVVGRELEPFVRQWHGAERLRSGQWRVPHHKWPARSVRTMFTDAMMKDLLDSNPWTGLRLENSRGRRDAIMLSPAELKVLVQKAREVYPDYPYFPAMIMVAAYTGMRPGELYALQWEDVDFARSRITVRHQFRSKTRDIAPPKNKEIRKIVLPDEAARALLELPLPHEGTVFLTKRGGVFHGRLHHYYWDPVRAAFGRPEMEFYELRHFCGSYMAHIIAETGRGSAQDIANQLGHTDNGVLAQKVYIHTYKETSLERIEEMFRRPVSREAELQAEIEELRRELGKKSA